MSEVYVNVNGTWKQASNYYVNVNGTWKEGSEIHTKVITLTSNLDNLLVYLDASSSWSYPRTGTTWIDLAGTSNASNFTLNGATFFSSNGGCIDFDGTNDYVERGSRLFNTGGSFSVSAWVYSDSFSGTNSYTIISNYGDTGSFQLRYKNGSGLQILESTISTLGTFTGSTLSAENWYNITVTFNNSTDVYTLYINGSSVSTITSSENFSADPDTIGANHSSTSEYWDGKIAQVFTFDTKLDASEVLANYNATKSNYTVVATNLVLHLDASNINSYSGSGTTWTDLSGNSNNASLTNGTTFDSTHGGSIVFDGTNDSVSISGMSSFAPSAVTFETWFLSAGASGSQGLVDKGRDNYGGYSLSLVNNNSVPSKIQWKTRVDSYNEVARDSDQYQDDVWTHAVGTYDGTNLKLYVNGVLKTTTNRSGTLGSNSHVITIGSTNDSLYFDGRISQARIYSSALSASEVLQNYNATKLKYRTLITSNLVLHLDAGDSSSYSGSGTTWTDLSGEGNHATLVNSPTYSSSDGGYLSFDGSNDHATLPAIDISGNEITFSIWTFAQSDSVAALIFFGDSTDTSGWTGRQLNVHLPYSNSYYFDKGHDGTTVDRISGSLPNSDWQNAWVNWTFTANASTGSMKIYRNGSSYASATGKTRTFNSANVDIRRIARFTNTYYDGYISKILLYKKELTASEVLQNYNIDKATYGH